MEEQMKMDNQFFNDCLHGSQNSKAVSNDNESKPRERLGGITITFPIKLHSMLQELFTIEVYSDIVTWSAAGDSFVILKPNAFTKLLLPKYFRTHKFSSFRRQLNAYGFTKCNPYTCQNDYHVYYHRNFLRDNDDRLSLVKRKYTLDRNELLTDKGKQKSIGTKHESMEILSVLSVIERTTTTYAQKVQLSQALSERC